MLQRKIPLPIAIGIILIVLVLVAVFFWRRAFPPTGGVLKEWAPYPKVPIPQQMERR